MPKIVFHVYPAISHCNSTFAVAKALRRDGNEIIYSGVEELRQPIEAQGFEFRLANVTPWNNPLGGLRVPRHSFVGRLRELRGLRRAYSQGRDAISRCTAFDSLVSAVKPAMVIVDAHYSYEALSLFRHGVPFAMFSTKLCLHEETAIPPMMSEVTPGRIGSRLLAWVAWKAFYFKRAILEMIYMPGYREVAKAAGRGWFSMEALNFRRSLGVGICTVPEFILAPKEFDYPREIRDNQHYVGPYVDLARSEAHYDVRFSEKMRELVDERKAGRPLVYCSLGSLPWQYRDTRDFIARLLLAATGARWNLILALGRELAQEYRGRRSRNVAICNYVPQLEVLRNCDLMITHGGMNSIKECIYFGVPMLVFPGTSDLDQSGNAARVLYHKIGVSGRMRRDTCVSIRAKIECILDNFQYKARIDKMRQSVLRSRAHLLGHEIVTCALSGQSTGSA